MKTATFNGRRFRVWSDQQVIGFADIPGDDPAIYVDPTLKAKPHLETAVHEALHACFPSATEDDIEQKGRDVARWLWRLGYRRRKNAPG